MNNAEEPAFARPNVPYGCESQIGLTKREYFAGLAMQGLLATPGGVTGLKKGDPTYSGYARASVAYADAILAELDKKPTTL